MSSRIKKNKKLLLVILLLVVSIGYALLSANLTINGNSKIAGQTWSIHWDNVQVTDGSVSLGNDDSDALITSNNTTEVTYEVTLSKPGDFYEFTVDAVNDGTVDGMINDIVSTYKIGDGETTIITDNNLPSYLIYSVSYGDGIALAENHELKAGQTETYKVRVEFKRDISNNELPGNDQSIIFSFGVDYEQANSNVISVPHPLTVYTANYYSDVWIGQAISNEITTYQTPALAMEALKQVTNSSIDKPIFLQHVLTNNIVTDSYVGFEVTDEMASTNEGMVAGIYTLKGIKGTNCSRVYNNGWHYVCENDSPYYEENVNTIKTAFGYDSHPERCYEYGQVADGSLYFRCSIYTSSIYFEAEAWVSGDVNTIHESFGCVGDANGRSVCYFYD